MLKLIFITLLSAAVTYLTTPWVIKLAKRFNLIDDPTKRYHPAHTHTTPVPRAGGIAICCGIISAILIFLPVNKIILSIIISLLILTAVGIWDDKKDVSPYFRLLTNLVVALIIVYSGTKISYITNPLTGGILDLKQWGAVITILWIVWTMNIVGWSSGVDGQMPGFVSISSLVLAILSLRYSVNDPTQMFVTLLALIVCGAFLGFIPWNFYPQKIMPGYSGKTIAGFLLAVLAVLSYGKLGTALLVLGIPMIDAGYALLRRVKIGRSPVWGDRGHLHHRLLDLGWGKRKIALFYWLVSAILGTVALLVNSKQKLFAFLFVIVGVTMLIIWVNFFSQLSKSRDPDNG